MTLIDISSKSVRHRLFLLTILLLSITMIDATATTGNEPIIRRPVEHYKLFVGFDTTYHSLSGVAELTFPTEGINRLGFLLNPDFTIKNATIGELEIKLDQNTKYNPEDISPDYGIFGKWDPSRATLWTAKIPKKVRDINPLILIVTYSGSLYTPPDNRQFSRETIAFEVDGTIGSEGIYLSPSTYWYPRVPDNQATHHVISHLPKGWNCVTVGDPEWMDEIDYTRVAHDSKAPLDGINFSAGPYIVRSVDHNGVKIMTYFLPAQASLSNGYIESCKGYIDMYGSMIAPYPFPKFAVVDNFLPSGYGMPGWTLLGSEVLRLPFIRFISLGHEVLHNWFGNSLLVDYRGGNWCEGSTVYWADHKYKEDKDASDGAAYRMNVLRDYAAFIRSDNEYPVSEFIARRESGDRAIGYGKAMMVFHMLRKMAQEHNEYAFNEAIRSLYKEKQWQAISWDDWQTTFERSYGKDLNWFFDQWVRRPGAPVISIENVNFNQNTGSLGGDFVVRTESRNESYQYLLPVKTTYKDGSYELTSHLIRKPVEKIDLIGEKELASIHLDPEFDVFRKIYPGEMPLTLAAFFGDPDGVLVLPSGGSNIKAYRTAAEGLKKKGQQVVIDCEITPEMKNQSLWIFGWDNENELLHEMMKAGDFGDISQIEQLNDKAVKVGSTTTSVMTHPHVKGKMVVITCAALDAYPVAGTRKLSHYGKYSYLVFEGDKNVAKSVEKASGVSPMMWKLGE